MKAATECISYDLGIPWPAINENLHACSFGRPIVVDEYVMSAIHWHAILGAHFDGGVGPAGRKPYDKAEIPLVPSRVHNVIETKLIASPVIGVVSLLKNLAAQFTEIHPRGNSKGLVQVEIPGLAEADFRFTPEFSGLAGRPIFIVDFASNQLSILARKSVFQVAVERIVRCQTVLRWLGQCRDSRLLPFVARHRKTVWQRTMQREDWHGVTFIAIEALFRN